MKFVNIKATVEMSRNLYVEVEDDATEEQIKSIAEEEILFPHAALGAVKIFLDKFNISTNQKLDLDDWNVEQTKIEIIE